ncbi:MAG: cobN/magnesium chelatase [Osedax symbiont Rs1]|nr:MAG: cobN/magnesium chelatase [Osedax symbiont Rs1]
MHLLAAKPGGFVDEEGIIDLDQSPADIVILTAADSQLAALSAGLQASKLLGAEAAPSVRIANWLQLIKPAAYDLYEQKVLSAAKVLIVSMLGGRSYWSYGFERMCEWAQQDQRRKLIFVPGDDSADPELQIASNVEPLVHTRLWRYLRESGIENSVQLLHFVAAEFFAINWQWREPQVLPRAQLYMPENPYRQTTYEQWQQQWQADDRQQRLADPNVAIRQRVAVLFYRSHLQSANTQMFDQFISQLRAAGLNPLPIAIASLKDPESINLVNALLEKAAIKLILNTTGFASNRSEAPQLSSQPSSFVSPFTADIPVLQCVLSSSTLQDWQGSSQGLRSRDVAMQVALPELDGRILTRAISFKGSSHKDQAAQVEVVRYELHSERAAFVIDLAKRYLQLSSKQNKDKSIALILANYPTKDGRIGNGVGLDTPNSCVNILRALQAAGYELGASIPENGNALIEQLLQSITNNPNTLHYLGCWQSIALDTYQQLFAKLPAANQQAVLERWGPAEQDHKYRDGRIMIAGIRLGTLFIGIQPARGFNLDLLANYHDPDLVPPHSYLAFYFWLKEVYKIDAVVHVGKHGNLEWLPGKGLALSEQCWPDIALGPVPHFYPFIVNDPGEGAQAKRRAQAVIIDHLMPPMSRAETYGELAELEALVDEYYQALGMDQRRETWLREKILEQVQSTHVLEELAIGKTAAKAGDSQGQTEREDQVLNQLDTYLCDIKEAQIRHGLHILGELPANHKLVDTIIALLRLPRGSAVNDAGLLHNMAIDFSLKVEGAEEGAYFDPSSATVQQWQGVRPDVLQQVSSDLWRTQADTRERLEQLAIVWVNRYVIGAHSLSELAAYPRITSQLNYCKQTIKAVLEESVSNELSALVDGLNGQFVAPGPSGAPTRGRLDTLPTGRNFFSLDNRSVPSAAAWALGQKSAQALIDRHLQEHGEYPQQLGLSVWGTATMRTGGDDIAQAFALMGVRPVWAVGSQRVVDIEVIPCMQLGRPRVDVTLRVSGFFRDAFANVMKLYDCAVQAIASMDDPGDSNVIASNIERRTAQLVAQGLSAEQAQRQASYRVFGSKPGAYGAGLQGLIDERCWEQASDLADAYLNWGGYAYTNSDTDAEQAIDAFKYQLSNLDVVVQNQDNREHDILDSDDYYQFQGGMSNAVTILSGRAPSIYHADHANPEKPVIRTLKEELNRVLRSRVLNPKWIAAMREHGYKGAFEMTASVDYMFAYDATTNLIDDYQYQKVADALLFDPQNQQFLQANNPHAMEEMAERLLEATQRGLWQNPDGYQEKLQDLLLSLDEQQEMGLTE